jgi:hypothetical protein
VEKVDDLTGGRVPDAVKNVVDKSDGEVDENEAGDAGDAGDTETADAEG